MKVRQFNIVYTTLFLSIFISVSGCSDMLNRYDKASDKKKGTTFLDSAFTIENDTEITYKTRVTLNITAPYAEQMRFRNSEGAWSVWYSVSDSIEWSLEPGQGERSVETEFMNADNSVISLSDDILLIEKLTASDYAVEDHFGTSVAVSSDGHTIVVGSPGDNGNDSGFYDNQGAIYIFHWNGITWDEQKITSANCLAGDEFGTSLSISSDGSRIAVGAPYHDVSASDQGAVYIFEKEAGIWTEKDMVFFIGGSSSDRFGMAVTLSGEGNTIAAGAPYYNNENGSVYIFTLSTGTFSYHSTIIAGNGINGDHFGMSVSLSGDGTIAGIGSPDSVRGILPNCGRAYIFNRNGIAWDETELNFTDPFGYDYFGSSIAVSVDGTAIAVCSRGRRMGVNERQGAAFVYRDEGIWTAYELTPLSGKSYDYFGSAIALNSDGTQAVEEQWEPK